MATEYYPLEEAEQHITLPDTSKESGMSAMIQYVTGKKEFEVQSQVANAQKNPATLEDYKRQYLKKKWRKNFPTPEGVPQAPVEQFVKTDESGRVYAQYPGDTSKHYQDAMPPNAWGTMLSAWEKEYQGERENKQKQLDDIYRQEAAGSTTLTPEQQNSINQRASTELGLDIPGLTASPQPTELTTPEGYDPNLQPDKMEGEAQAAYNAEQGITTGTTTGGTTTGESIPNTYIEGVDTTGWSPEMVDLYNELQGQLDVLIKDGQMINPDIDITPEMTSDFLKQAKKELDPYYGQIIEVASQDLRREADYLKATYAATEERYMTQGERAMQGKREQMAEMGLAFSGRRGREEGQITSDLQSALGSAQRGYQYSLSGLGASAEQTYGTDVVSQWDLPLYNISGGITGSLERERTVAEQSRVSELEAAYRSQRALTTYQQT